MQLQNQNPVRNKMYTKQQRREIYFTAYCCLDGEGCDFTKWGLCWLLSNIIDNTFWAEYIIEEFFPELQKLKPKDADIFWFERGSPGWPERKEILIKAIELTYKK